MKCPYCGSNDISEYGSKTDMINQTYIIVYRCYGCNRMFDEKEIKDCGKQTFCHGDNHPALPIPKWLELRKKERLNFKDLGIVPIRTRDNLTDLWIDLWDFLKETVEKKT